MTLTTLPQAYTDSILWALPSCQMDWELTPPAVQDCIRDLQKRVGQLQNQVETLQGRLEQTSQTSSKPPSSDSPCKKPKRKPRQSHGKRGARKGHRGTGPTLLSPTEVHLIEPGPCAYGHGELVSLTPYYTHQVIELPPIEIDRYHDRADEPGRLTRRLQRELASLWVFLCEHGVEPTHNRAERALRFAVMCASAPVAPKVTRAIAGWVERTLSLRQTCRQLGQSTFGVLIDAVTSAFQGRQPDLTWLY